MHIGTGQFEGKKLKDSHDGAPLSTRTLTIKESVFEIIGTRIQESSVLDINDRNGMYGIEAISKGAAVVQFLNIHNDDKILVRENLKIVGLDPDDFMLDGDPETFISKKSEVSFDIIFFRAVDNHCLSMVEKILSLQSKNGISVVMYPNDNECSLDLAPEGFEMIDCREAEIEKIAMMVRKK